MTRDAGTLLDIATAARRVGAYVGPLAAYDDFLADDMAQSAVLFQLTVIGEATKRLSPAFRASHPDVPWKQMAGMRDRLIHGYDGIDLEIVWETATVEVPQVLRRVTPLLPDADAPDLFS